MTGVISTPNLAFYFPDETVKTLNERWDDWVARGATVVTKKDQAEDTPGSCLSFYAPTSASHRA